MCVAIRSVDEIRARYSSARQPLLDDANLVLEIPCVQMRLAKDLQATDCQKIPPLHNRRLNSANGRTVTASPGIVFLPRYTP